MSGHVVAQYEILSKIAEGGMGTVYKARDTQLNRLVALKFINPNLTNLQEAREQLIAEARAASSLDHPNICTIYEVGESPDGQLFMAMAYYEGQTLHQLLEAGQKKKPPLSLNKALDIARQIARGMAYAYKKNILHQDLKPENIIITSEGLVKILDFGLAAARTFQPSSTSGTSYYMSPEKILAETVNQRSDIWSYGVLLYELLTGNLPFQGQFEQDLYYIILSESPDMDALKEMNLPGELHMIIEKSLQKEAKNRFATFEQILAVWPEQVERSRLNRTGYFSRLSFFLLALLFLAAIIYIRQRARQPALKDLSNRFVLVAEFENLTQEPIFSDVLTEALRVSLRQSSKINLFPSYRIPDALKRMELPAGQILTPNVALELARRENIPLIIGGDIKRMGSVYLLSTHIMDSQSGDILFNRHLKVTGLEDILGGMDQLAAALRKGLGESLAMIRRHSDPLQKETTHSLKALGYYSRGIRLEAQGKYEESIILKEKALSLDSTFVMAISSLSYSYKKIGNEEKALFYHKKILPLIDRVSEREKFQILILYYGPSFEMNYAKAAEYAHKYVTLYPHDALAYAFLGHLTMFTGDYRTSIRASLKAANLDTFLAGTCFDNAAYAYALAGKADSAVYYFNKSKSKRPAYLSIDRYLGQTLWMEGKADSAEQIFRRVTRYGNYRQKMISHALLIALYYSRGQLKNALHESRSTIRQYRALDKAADEAYFHYLSGEIYAEQSKEEAYLREMNRALSLCGSPFNEYFLVAASFARRGFIKKAAVVLDRWNSVQSEAPYFNHNKFSFTNFILGELALSENRPLQALRFFKKVGQNSVVNPVYLLAQKEIALAHSRLQDSLALPAYLKLLQNRGPWFFASMPTIRKGGLWTAEFIPQLWFELGLTFSQNKDSTSAAEYLQKALQYWAEADTDFSKAKQAKMLLQQLTKAEHN